MDPANPFGVRRRLSFLAAVFLAVSASTASAQILRGGPVAATSPRLVRTAPNPAVTFRPLVPGEVRFLGSTAPVVANVTAPGAIEGAGLSNPGPEVIRVPTTPVSADAWTDTVVVASPRPDSSPMNVILTGAVVRIALEHP